MKRIATFILALLSATAFAQIPLQQSTASQAVKLGPFVDSTDGNTEETALTIANTDIKCSKNGGALASKNSGGGTHDANGWYTVTFDATDTNTAGRFSCYVHVAGALPVFREFMVYPTANYAALFSTAPGASGGLLISGSNSGTTTLGALTVTGTATISDGLVVARSTSNQPAATFTGNGTGNGVTIASGSGATGTGLAISSAATNGAAVTLAGVGSGNGLTATGGATGHGISGIGGSTSGHGLKTGITSLAVSDNPDLGMVTSGTLQSATATTAVLGSATSFADDILIGATLNIIAGTGAGQSRSITDWVNTTDTATVATWITTPDSTSVYTVWQTAASSGGGGGGLDAAGVRAAIGLASANLDTQLSTIDDFVDTEVAAIKTKTDFLPSATAGASGGVFIAGTNAATSVTTALTANITGNVSGSVGSVTGNVGGNVTGSVGSIASGGIADTSFATTAGPLRALGIVDQGTAQSATGTTLVLRSAAAFANSELVGARILITGGSAGVGQSRLITGYVGSTDTATVATWDTTPTGTITYTVTSATAAADGGGLDAAATRAALGMSSANLDTQLGTLATSSALSTVSGKVDVIDDYVDTEIAAIQSSISGLNNLSASGVLNSVVEPNGSITLKCALAVGLAYAAGDLTTTTGTSTYKDPSGTSDRIAGTVSSPGNRLASVTCPP